MRKINSELLVCNMEQTQQLMGLGILPVSCFCYEWVGVPGKTVGISNGRSIEVRPPIGEYQFGGEYVGQEGAIPAWTYEELLVLIGPDYWKPDLFGKNEWTDNINMMQFALVLPTVRKDYKNGAQAMAELLAYLLLKKEVTAKSANERMDFYVTKEHYNPVREAIKKDIKKKK